MVDTKELDKEYSDIKAGVEGLGDVPAPSGSEEDYTITDNSEAPASEYQETPVAPVYNEPAANYEQQGMDSERVHAIIESVVSEKFEELTSNLGDLSAWKEKVNNDIVSIKQEVLRVTERFENLQTAILGRVKEYDQGITNVHTEMKALEKVLGKIMEPLITNVKELSKITEDLKKSKK